MSEDIQSDSDGRDSGPPRWYSVAGAGMSLATTLICLSAIGLVLFRETPAFLPSAWPYDWIVELSVLWGLPFFLTVWRLVTAVLEESFGGHPRDTLDRPPTP